MKNDREHSLPSLEGCSRVWDRFSYRSGKNGVFLFMREFLLGKSCGLFFHF